MLAAGDPDKDGLWPYATPTILSALPTMLARTQQENPLRLFPTFHLVINWCALCSGEYWLTAYGAVSLFSLRYLSSIFAYFSPCVHDILSSCAHQSRNQLRAIRLLRCFKKFRLMSRWQSSLVQISCACSWMRPDPCWRFHDLSAAAKIVHKVVEKMEFQKK